jgi:hypothetical protein
MFLFTTKLHFKYTQNVFGILKSEILLHKLAHLSILKTLWVYLKDLSILKNLSILKTNFEKADGLGIGISLKDEDTVGKKMARNGRKKAIEHFTQVP